MTAASSNSETVATSDVTTKSSFTVSTPSDREIVMTRLFDAPRELVFDAMTKPEHIRNWFGLRGSTLPVCEVDHRPGGNWRYLLRESNGNEMGMHGTYREIVRPERMVTTEIFDDWPDSETVVTVVLTEQGGRTLLTTTVLYPSIEVRDAVIGSGMAKGAAVSYDRLAEHLEKMVVE